MLNKCGLRYTGSGGTSGIYHCDIETIAARNNDGHATLYILDCMQVLVCCMSYK